VNAELDSLDRTQSALRRMRILIVDDDQANTVLLAGLLRRWHFTNVVAITDPTLVLAEFADLVPDLLLLDVNMPVLNATSSRSHLIPRRSGCAFQTCSR
jgi:CheY-like chemotaxis protein